MFFMYEMTGIFGKEYVKESYIILFLFIQLKHRLEYLINLVPFLYYTRDHRKYLILFEPSLVDIRIDIIISSIRQGIE